VAEREWRKVASRLCKERWGNTRRRIGGREIGVVKRRVRLNAG